MAAKHAQTRQSSLDSRPLDGIVINHDGILRAEVDGLQNFRKVFRLAAEIDLMNGEIRQRASIDAQMRHRARYPPPGDSPKKQLDVQVRYR